MANQVQDIVLRLKNEGFEAIDKIRSSFRELGKVTNFTETDLQRIRKEILNFGASADRTTQSLRGQVEALKAVQGQATINSRVYSQLGKDIKDLNVAYKEAATGVTQFSDAQLKAQKAGARPTVFSQQIAVLKKELQNLSVYSKAYSDQLTKIQQRELPFNLAQGRQNVIAAEAAYRLGPELANAATVMPTMPDTTAALSQRYQELSARLSNVVRGSSDYINTSIELANVQRQIREELIGTANAYADLATKQRQATKIEQVRQYNESRAVAGMPSYLSGLTAPYRDPNTGIMIAPGGLTLGGGIRPRTQYPSPLEVPEASPLFASIGKIVDQSALNKAQLLGRSYDEVAGSIRRVSAASDGSLNSLRAQRQVWELLRDTLGDNRTALRDVDKELTDLDRKIEARGRPRARQGFTGLGAAQTAGAVISGGIFGGPEGLLGGVLGAAGGFAVGGGPGALGGAFAGSAIGAQIGVFRQAAFGAGEYSANVDRLNIALRGVVKTQSEYADAQQAIRLAQVNLNLPILESTEGFTRLSAAVIAAGGKVSDVTTVFNGVTQAIKATGGSSEQIQASLTALTQIFSKGKASAEEIQGQLGERLPGAVSLFASATNRTLPKLQKDLQDGVVGLNDVMKFAVKLNEVYGNKAQQMAASTEDSTARMQASLKDLQYAFGSIVKPISASIQNVIGRLADMATAALRALNLVKSASSELGAAGRAKDLQNRASYAYSALGQGGQSYAEKQAALRFAEQLANAATPQKSIIGVKQNIQALQQARDVVRQINGEYDNGVRLTDKQLDILQKYGVKLDTRIQSEQTLLKTLQDKNKTTDFGNLNQDKLAEKQREEQERLAKKQQADAEAAAAEQQRLNEALAKSKIEFNNTVHANALELLRKEYEYAIELDQKRLDNWVKTQTGAARSAAGLISGFLNEIQGLGLRTFGAREAVQSAQQQLRSSQALAATTIGMGGTAASIGAAATQPLSFSASQLQAASREAAKFTGIANMCSESVKAFYRSLGITLPGVTAWADTVRKAGQVMTDWSKLQPGDIVATGRPGDTPHVGVYTGGNNVFHQSRSRGLVAGNYPDLNYFRSGYYVRPSAMAGAARQPTGMAAAMRRDVAAEGAIDVAQIDLAKAEKLFEAEKKQVDALNKLIGEGFVLDFTQQIREQNAALENSASITALRNRLQLEGQRPEYIDAEVSKAEAVQKTTQENLAAMVALDKLTQAGKANSEQAQRLRDGMMLNNEGLQKFIQLTDAATAAQIAFNDAMRVRQDARIGTGFQEGITQYIESIGTLRKATSDLAQTGIKGIEDAIFSLVTTGTANFREFAANILQETARVIIQQLVLRTVLQSIFPPGGGGGGIGALAGAVNANGNIFASNGIQPFAMGGIVNQPTLFRYANGGVPGLGLMGEAGPEAIVPLQRGANGKLGIAGGGGTYNVTVNVEAGGATTQTQGDPGQGAQLGRLIAGAVQAELIKQQRPGGLLAQR